MSCWCSNTEGRPHPHDPSAYCPPKPSRLSGDPSDSLPDTYEDVQWAAEQEFLAASLAVWQEIDRVTEANDGVYPGLPPSDDLRKRERAAWDAYKPWLASHPKKEDA